jgi:phosphoglycolate phosphatase
LSNKHVIIFDFDGTIANTFPVVLDIFHHVQKREMRLTKEEEDMFRSAAYLHVPIGTVIKAATQLNIPIVRLPFLYMLTQRLLRKRMKEVKAYPGVIDQIRKLKNDGYLLYIVSTNSTRNIKTFIELNELQGAFVRVYGSVFSPNKYKVISRIAKLHKGNSCMYIGDEIRDVRAAKLARVTSVAVTWGYNETDVLIQSNPDSIIAKPSEISGLIH